MMVLRGKSEGERSLRRRKPLTILDLHPGPRQANPQRLRPIGTRMTGMIPLTAWAKRLRLQAPNPLRQPPGATAARVPNCPEARRCPQSLKPCGPNPLPAEGRLPNRILCLQIRRTEVTRLPNQPGRRPGRHLMPARRPHCPTARRFRNRPVFRMDRFIGKACHRNSWTTYSQIIQRRKLPEPGAYM